MMIKKALLASLWGLKRELFRSFFEVIYFAHGIMRI